MSYSYSIIFDMRLNLSVQRAFSPLQIFFVGTDFFQSLCEVRPAGHTSTLAAAKAVVLLDGQQKRNNETEIDENTKTEMFGKKTSIFIIFPGPVLKSTDIRCQQSLTQNHMRSYEIHDMKHVASDNLFIHVSDPSFTLITKDSSAVTKAGNTAHKPSKAAATRPCLEHIEASDCWLLHSLIFSDVTMMSSVLFRFVWLLGEAQQVTRIDRKDTPRVCFKAQPKK